MIVSLEIERKHSHKLTTHTPLHSFLRFVDFSYGLAAQVVAMLSNCHNPEAQGTWDSRLKDLQANLEILHWDSFLSRVVLNLDEVVTCWVYHVLLNQFI